MRPYLITFIIAAASALALTPLVEALARRLGAVDVPDERKIHTEPVARIGGVALYAGFILAVAARIVVDRIGHPEYPLLPVDIPLLGIVLGATAVFAVGLADDLFDLKPGVKFAGQSVAAVILVASGVQIEFVGNPIGGGLLYLDWWWAIPLTLFWVLGFTNTVNFMDGLDGLAAGVSAIAAVTFFVFAYDTGQTAAGILSALVAGLCVGFLWHNFHPAKIFMGDSGALFLGFVLSAVAMQGVMKSIAAIAFLVPIVIMGVPILDTAWAILRRWRKGQKITAADAGHIHHRLLHRGFSHRQTVLLIWAWTALLSAGGLSLRFAPNTIKLAVFAVLMALSFAMARLLGLFEPYQGAHRAGKAKA